MPNEGDTPLSIRIGVIGNCQARPLGTTLAESIAGIQIDGTVVVHLARDEDADRDLAALESADLVLAQRVADDYPTRFVRTEELRGVFGDRLLVWPNLYYRGYNPELIYLRDADHRPLQGPLGDYHLSVVHEAWKSDLSIEEAVRRLRSVDHNAERFADVPEQSLVELVQREQDCDVRMSDWLAEHRWTRRLFFTFNHPSRVALDELVRRIAQTAGLPDPAPSGGDVPFEPLGRWRAPLNPWVRSTFAPTFEDDGDFVGCDVELAGRETRALAPPVRWDVPRLVERYYETYRAAFDQ